MDKLSVRNKSKKKFVVGGSVASLCVIAGVAFVIVHENKGFSLTPPPSPVAVTSNSITNSTTNSTSNPVSNSVGNDISNTSVPSSNVASNSVQNDASNTVQNDTGNASGSVPGNSVGNTSKNTAGKADTAKKTTVKQSGGTKSTAAKKTATSRTTTKTVTPSKPAVYTVTASAWDSFGNHQTKTFSGSTYAQAEQKANAWQAQQYKAYTVQSDLSNLMPQLRTLAVVKDYFEANPNGKVDQNQYDEMTSNNPTPTVTVYDFSCGGKTYMAVGNDNAITSQVWTSVASMTAYVSQHYKPFDATTWKYEMQQIGLE